MVFVVRKAVEEDIPQIQEITREAFESYARGAEINYPLAALSEAYSEIKTDLETKLVLVAVANGSVIGSVRVETKPDHTAYLSRFGVSSSYQNNGVGRILMNAVDNSMMEAGVSHLYLHTASRMLSLVRFYYGRGFYIESTAKDRGYIRALLCKEYAPVQAESPAETFYADCAAI
ncbi:MAG: GNAT family N-acetyltransferase [Bacillota bacterium]|nr:GNAT family N-acetyltransferase [Bacillota bacterium]